MNAYELAYKLWQEGLQAATMLHQQADELDKVVPQLVKANGLIENLRLRIAELEKQCEALADEYAIQVNEVCKLTYENEKLEKQTKPLSDEEIKQIWYNLYPLSSSSYWDDKREGLAELKFARAIEERVRGIK